MAIDPALLEINAYQGEGYLPLVDYESWRVAILRYIDELLPERLDNVQRHDETDEVFVLLAGRCILFIGSGDEQVVEITAQDMEPLKLYNVKRGCWHTHTLSEDATVLIVENRNTGDDNSPKLSLNQDQRAQLVQLTEDLWG
jgi:hypothetical protein